MDIDIDKITNENQRRDWRLNLKQVFGFSVKAKRLHTATNQWTGVLPILLVNSIRVSVSEWDFLIVKGGYSNDAKIIAETKKGNIIACTAQIYKHD